MGYAKRSPFKATRWNGDDYEVRVDDDWFRLDAIDDLPLTDVVDFCKTTYGSEWEKRLDEDLVEVLSRMGAEPGASVTLRVRMPGSGETRVLSGVAMTESNRAALYRARMPAAAPPMPAADAARSAREAAEAAAASVTTGPWGLAVATIADGKTEVVLRPGAEELTEHSLFQIGSITKTMTGFLLANAVVRTETSLDATVGSILGEDAGTCSEITLLHLATQSSGLPPLPPNLRLDAVDPQDPYAGYTEDDLIEALKMVAKPAPGAFEYSNFGFMLLGLLLERATGTRYADLAAARIFEPLGMAGAMCGVPDGGPVMPGYRSSSHVPWWGLQLPGPGGVACGINDLATYVASYISPPPPMEATVDLAARPHAPGPPPIGLGWIHQLEGRWHNGGTGGFHSFCAFHKPSGTGIALLANSADARDLDQVGMRTLNQMAQSRREL